VAVGFVATPGVAALSITTFTSTIQTPVTVIPQTRELILTEYAPNLGAQTGVAGYYYYLLLTN
jgi:hypothetical protein